MRFPKFVVIAIVAAGAYAFAIPSAHAEKLCVLYRPLHEASAHCIKVDDLKEAGRVASEKFREGNTGDLTLAICGRMRCRTIFRLVKNGKRTPISGLFLDPDPHHQCTKEAPREPPLPYLPLYIILNDDMNILAIETSCDESGVALLSITGAAGRTPQAIVRENFVASQVKLHREFGGVVPNLAKREHLKNLPILYGRLEKKLRARGEALKFDAITVTVGPGLEPALWTGITFAQELAKKTRKPLIGANHLEGHLYSFLLPASRQKEAASSKFQIRKNRTKSQGPNSKDSKAKEAKIQFPAIALIVSGGHTTLLKMDSLVNWKLLGETRDDAAGEAFDKAARLIDLPYPGGPEIERLARTGDPHMAEFPRPMIHEKNYDFSFSGLKTAVLYYVRDNPSVTKTEAGRAGLAASFQAAALDVLVVKTMRAVREYGAKSVILCGGVAANRALRTRLAREAKKAGAAFLVPRVAYNLDNAAMIGLAGYMAHLRGRRYPLRARGNLEI